MRIILISAEQYLPGFLEIANKDLDIAAVVMPLPHLYKNVSVKINDKVYKFYSYAYLKECIEDVYHDYIVIAIPPYIGGLEERISEYLKELNVDREIIFWAGAIYLPWCHMFLHMFNYVQDNISKFKILITGNSHAKEDIAIECFEYPLFNCAIGGQDLYYQYQFAKKAFNMENNSFKYALIGIEPYSFHWDQSHPRGGGMLY